MPDPVAFVRARLDEDEATWRREQAEGYGADAPWMADRMLREVEAMRVILSHHDDQHDCGDPLSWTFPYVGCQDVRALAAIWRDHPDYHPDYGPAYGDA